MKAAKYAYWENDLSYNTADWKRYTRMLAAGKEQERQATKSIGIMTTDLKNRRDQLVKMLAGEKKNDA